MNDGWKASTSGDASPGRAVKRAFLYALIGSIALSAALGVLAILSGRQLGALELRVLLTTVTVAGASMCGLGCGAYLGAGRGRALPLAGIILTLLSSTMVIAGIWLEVSEDVYWKLAVCAAVFSVACAHLSLLSLARLAAPYRWSLKAAHVAIFGVASLIAALVLGASHGEATFRFLGVAAILDAAISVLIPIFHRLSRGAAAAPAGGLAGGAAVRRAAPGDLAVREDVAARDELAARDDPAARDAPAVRDDLADLDVEIARLRARLAQLERRREEASRGG